LHNQKPTKLVIARITTLLLVVIKQKLLLMPSINKANPKAKPYIEQDHHIAIHVIPSMIT